MTVCFYTKRCGEDDFTMPTTTVGIITDMDLISSTSTIETTSTSTMETTSTSTMAIISPSTMSTTTYTTLYY